MLSTKFGKAFFTMTWVPYITSEKLLFCEWSLFCECSLSKIFSQNIYVIVQTKWVLIPTEFLIPEMKGKEEQCDYLIKHTDPQNEGQCFKLKNCIAT